jgi:transcriptional regulator with XRE-family HTH domain
MKINGASLRRLLQKHRRITNMTQTQLAEMLGVDKSYISNAIKNNGMRDDRVAEIAKILKVDIAVLTDLSDLESGSGVDIAEELKKLKTENENLKSVLAFKEREVALLEENIKLLRERQGI